MWVVGGIHVQLSTRMFLFKEMTLNAKFHQFNRSVQSIQHYLGLASSLALKHSFSPYSVLHVSCNLKVLTLLHCLLTSCYKSVLTSKVLTFFVFMNSEKVSG